MLIEYIMMLFAMCVGVCMSCLYSLNNHGTNGV